MAITPCRPSVIAAVLPTVSDPVLITDTTPQATKLHPDGGDAGVPATNRFEPLIRPTVAPATGIGVPNAGAEVKSTVSTLAVAPPHSGPQFRMKALVSLPLKTPVYG